MEEYGGQGFVCERCGRCCLELDAHQTTVSAEDVARWWAQGRDDILEWVEPVMSRGEVFASGDYQFRR
jgi:hypothetical protein